MDMNKKIPEADKSYKDALTSRFYKFTRIFLDKLFNEKKIVELSSLTDEELFYAIYSCYIEHIAKNEDEEKRLKQIAQGTATFYKYISDLGGYLKAGEVAELLNVSRQTVHNRLNNRRLLSLKPSTENIFPVFQFHGTSLVPHLEEILTRFDEDIVDSEKVRFLTGMSFFDDQKKDKTLIELLRTGSLKEDEISSIKDKATMFGSQSGI